MPRFEYTNEVERYDTKEEDIKIGDIRWVNFPSIHRYDRLPNGDSTRCIRHPGLIIDKIEGAKRCIKVAEISHRHTGFERRLGNSPYLVTCDIIAILTPDHFSETLDYFDPESDEFKKIIDHIKYAEDSGRQVVLTQEQMIGMMNEEAEYGTNWFISEDDIYLNWNKWEDGSAHLVFVNGLSGSGKSTLGRKISENYDAYYVELDVYGWGLVGEKAVERGYTKNYDYVKEKDRKLYEYMKAKHIPPDIFAKIDRWGDIPEETEFKVREIEKYLHWLAFEQKERVVVEGGYTGVVINRNPELWKDTPIIFKGTSVTKSIFRRMVRASKKNGPIEIVHVIKAIKPQYMDHMIPETNASRKAMLSGRDDWEYVKEATSSNIPNMEFKKSNDGTYNAITYINGHMYRPRAEILILNEEGEILLRKSKEVNQYGTKYNLPGGGFDNPNEKPEDVAFRESCEEVRIIPKDVKYTDIVYISEYGDKVPEWHKRILWPVGIKYVGAISYVCIGTYDKRYNQYIKVKDRQDYIDEYNFYEYDDIKTMLRQEHIEALNMYHEEHNESNMLKEGFTEIMGNKKDRSPHNKKKKLDLRKIPTKIVDFKDFLRKIKTPEMVMKWFLKVKVRWTPHGGSNDHPFQWPDWLIKQRMGNCFDQSIFLHYFCRAKHIDHKMYLVTWLADNGQGTGHAVPLYKKGDKVYVFAYLNPKMGFIGGPFRSYGEAKRVLDNYFLMYINQFFKAPSTPYSSYLSDDDLANFDKYYNNRKITQTEYIIEGLGKNMRSSHLFKIKVKGFAFPNPILPAYDCIITVFSIIGAIYNYFTANEEVDIDYGEGEVLTEEEQLSEDDWIHDPSLMYRRSNKRKFDKIKNFDQFCKEIDTPEEALSYFIIEKIRWSSMEEMTSINRPFYWPDDIIRDKIGVCMDQTILMHQFYDYKGIENKSGFMIWIGENNEDYSSHIVPMFKRNGRIYCAVYLPNIGWIHGPFDSWSECVKETAKALASCSDLVQGIGKKIHTITEVVPDEFMKEADECSRNRKDITWYKFITEDGCRRIRNTKLLNFHYKSISIWNPIIGVWNVIRFLRNNFGLDIPYYGLEEETTLLEEKLSADERRCFGLPKKKKYPMPDEAHVRAAIRFFNHCDPEDEEELARNIKKYMKKYNMKDVNVSDNNRFKKYYHPEEDKEEKKPIQENGTFRDTLFVYNRLTDKEKSLLGRHHIDSPACVYRKVEYDGIGITPIGWIELYDSSKVAMMTNQEYDENIKDLNIAIAVDKEFRGRGVATKLIKNAIRFFKSSQYETLTYIVRDGNDRSEAFAKKCGFAYMWRRKKEHETVYMITNPTKMRNAINEAYLYIRASVNAARRSLSMLESSAAMGGPVVGMEINDQTVQYSNPGMFIIQYSDGNESGYGVTNDLKTKYFLRHDKKKNKLIKEDFDNFLKDKYFGIYSITQEHRDLWNNLLTSFYEDPKYLTKEARTLSLYEYFSGRRELIGDQIDYDENFNRVEPVWLDIMYNMKVQDPKMINIPVINEDYHGGSISKHISVPKGVREFTSSLLHSNELVLCEDPKGMYLLDENNNLVSRYITQEELEVISNAF